MWEVEREAEVKGWEEEGWCGGGRMRRWEDVEMEERQWRSHVSLSTKYIPTL